MWHKALPGAVNQDFVQEGGVSVAIALSDGITHKLRLAFLVAYVSPNSAIIPSCPRTTSGVCTASGLTTVIASAGMLSLAWLEGAEVTTMTYGDIHSAGSGGPPIGGTGRAHYPPRVS